MNRRAFLGSLGALAAGMVLDPERALWMPGRTSYFDLGAGREPVIESWNGLHVGDVITMLGVRNGRAGCNHSASPDSRMGVWTSSRSTASRCRLPPMFRRYRGVPPGSHGRG